MDRLEQATEQVVRYFVQVDDPSRATHKRSVEAILGRYIQPEPVMPAAVVVAETDVAAREVAEPGDPFVKKQQTTVIASVIDTVEDAATPKRVPHVRGDVAAYSMVRKSGAVTGQRYIVSYRATQGATREAISFEATLVSRTTNAAGEEVLVFDNGVRVIDDMERFRFQRSG